MPKTSWAKKRFCWLEPMIKILADECINNDLISALKNRGHDVMTVHDIKIVGSTDEKVLEKAVELKRTLLTFDRGFGDIFRFDVTKNHGVIILLVNNLSKEEIITLPTDFLATVKEKNDLKGNLIIIGKTRIRIIT